MKSLQRGWLVTLVLVLTSSCLSTAGKAVIATYNRDDVRPCQLLKRLHSASGSYAYGRWGEGSAAEKGNENEMRSDTAKLGGNVVLVVTGTRGEAYKCPADVVAAVREGAPAPPAATPSPAPAPTPPGS